MMINENPNNIRFVTGVVIPNGVPDDQNDVFTKKEIKQLFIKYLEHDTDSMHNYIRNEGVDLVANWITEIDREIQGKIAPVGSWMSTFKVTNPELIELLDNHTIGGLSLGSIPREVLTQKFWFLDKPIKDIHTFRDLPSVDDANPVFISFVKKGSNGYGLEIEKPDVYINKSSKEENTMSNEEIKTNNDMQDEKISLSGLAKIKEIFSINKSATESAEPKQEVKVETKPVEPVETKPANNDDISNTELLEKIPNAVATGITSAFEKMAEKEKPDDEEDEEEEEEVKNTETSEPTKKVPKINKSATTKEEQVQVPNTSTDFYSKSGRDMFGCRIRK